MAFTLSETLKTRWLPTFDGHSAVIRKHFDQALGVVETLGAKRAELSTDKNLSDVGRAQKLNEFAKAEAARVAKASRTLDTARKTISEKRAALVPSVRDKTDVAAALLRREQRDILRTMDSPGMMKILTDANTPMSMLEAIFEAPHLVPAIPPDVKERLVNDLLERIAPAAVASLREQDSALELLETSIQAGSHALREAAGVTSHEYAKWIAEAAPVDAKTVEAEKEQFRAQSVETGALALPLAARMSLVESLLATNTAEISKAA
jgi:hypothetical protein